MIAPDLVAFFMPELRRSGVELVFSRLAAGLAEHGLRVHIVVVDGSGLLRDELPDDATLFDLRAGRVLRAVLPLAGYLKQHSPRILVAGEDHANVAAVWARKIARGTTKLVLTAHSPIRSNLEGQRRWTGRFLNPAVKWFYPLADEVVAVSDNVAADLLVVAPGVAPRLQVISNPVIPIDLEALGAKPSGQPWLDQPGGPPVVLAVGRLDSVKDYPTFLRAVAEVRVLRPIRGLILGDGPERANLEALAISLGISDDVRWLGNVVNPFAFYSKARLLCITSRYEAGPMVLVEAVASCLPVVSTDCSPTVRLFLGDRGLGRVVPRDDPGALALAIIDCIENRAQPGEHADLVRPYLNATSVGNYLELFRSLGLNSPS